MRSRWSVEQTILNIRFRSVLRTEIKNIFIQQLLDLLVETPHKTAVMTSLITVCFVDVVESWGEVGNRRVLISFQFKALATRKHWK